jgi:chorismate mutase / prephenate dehydrogenase
MADTPQDQMSIQDELSAQRAKLDHIDERILDLLQHRAAVIEEVVAHKARGHTPVFVAEREQGKARAFRELAVQRGLDADWAEDFLRMIMSVSRPSSR